MANEFIARKGIISLDSAQITGSLSVTGNISASIFTGSFRGDGSQLSGIEGFPFTGSAGITGSLTVVGPVNATTFTGDGSQLTGIEGFPFTGSARITGSLVVIGPVNATSFTGSIQGTATSASYIQLANVDGFTAYSASVNTAIDSVLDATTPLTATVNTGSSPLTLTTQSIVVADSTNGNLIVNLPDLNTVIGTPNQKPIVVYKNDYSQNVIYVNPSGSQLVNGASQDIIVSIQLAVIYNPTSARWVTEGTSAQSLAELELFFLSLTETGSLATTGSNVFIGNQSISGSLNVSQSITANNLVAEGSGMFGGVADFKHGIGYYLKGEGYSSIFASPETFTFVNYTAAATSSQFILSAQGFTPNVARTFTLPDTSGTVALTSNLSSYLPLTGGTITGSLTVTGGITGSAASASYVEYTNVANKPALVSSSTQIVGYNIFATTGSNQFNGSQAITGSLTVTGQVVAQTLNVQQVTSSIVYSSGSNIFGNSLGNTQQFTGSVSVTGSLAVAGTGTFSSNGLFGGSSAISGLAGGISVNGSTNSGINFRIADTLRGYVYVAGNGSMNLESTSGSVVLSPNGSPALTIASTGAATFASSVGIGGATTVGKLDLKTATANIPALGTLGNGFNMVRADGLLGMSIGWENAVGSWYWQGQRTDSAVALNLALQPLGGNVGIGTTSPDTFSYGGGYKFLTFRATATNEEPFLQLIANGVGNSIIDFGNATIRRATIIGIDGSHLAFYTNGSNSGIGVTERMRITSGGKVLINTTNETAKLNMTFGGGGQNGFSLLDGDNTVNATFIDFKNSSGTIIGYIGRAGGTNAVVYSTTSDYRLKEDFKDFNALEKISGIKVYDFRWKDTNERTDGVIAHELAEVVPFAVMGEKDKVNEEGNIIYQGVDYSKLVPILIKAIQEQQSQIESLKAEIQTLKQ